MRIRFLRDIFAGTNVLYGQDQVVEVDNQIGRMFVLDKHAVKVVGANKIDRSETPGDVKIDAPQGRCVIPAGASGITVTTPYCYPLSAVLVQIVSPPGDGVSGLRVRPVEGAFFVKPNAPPSRSLVFDFVVLPH